MDLKFTSFPIAQGKAPLEIGFDPTDDDPVSNAIAQNYLWSGDNFSVATAFLEGPSTILDIGAHIGTFSLIAGYLGHKVISFEPLPKNFEIFNTSIDKNNLRDNITVLQVAASDTEGSIEFVGGGPGGHIKQEGSKEESISVKQEKIDKILKQVGVRKVDFIKLDVEGYELRVIKGMENLLEDNDAPTILFESNGFTLNFFDQTPNTLFRQLEGFGYQIFVIVEGRLVPISSYEPVPFCVCDCLAVKENNFNKLTKLKIDLPLSSYRRKFMFNRALQYSNGDCLGFFKKYLELWPELEIETV